MNIQTLWVRGLGLTLWLASGAFAGMAADNQAEEQLPNSVPFELGKTQFAPGDSITIQTVRGTAGGFRTNETYCVEGTYTLSSRDEAELALFVTTRQDIRTRIDPRQKLHVKKGTGSFRLIQTMAAEGYPHVSFYPAASGNAFGGIYFGQGNWLWAEKSPGPASPAAEHQDTSKASGSAETQVILAGANRVLLDYLGNPVEAPADLDAAYAPARLRQAVQAAATKAGVSLRKIVIDDSEFPSLVGVTGIEGDFPKLKAGLAKMAPYEYYGDVGSKSCCTFTIIPSRVWPPEARQRIYRRAMLRMQVFYDRISAQP